MIICPNYCQKEMSQIPMNLLSNIVIDIKKQNKFYSAFFVSSLMMGSSKSVQFLIRQYSKIKTALLVLYLYNLP